MMDQMIKRERVKSRSWSRGVSRLWLPRGGLRRPGSGLSPGDEAEPPGGWGTRTQNSSWTPRFGLIGLFVYNVWLRPWCLSVVSFRLKTLTHQWRYSYWWARQPIVTMAKCCPIAGDLRVRQRLWPHLWLQSPQEHLGLPKKTQMK